MKYFENSLISRAIKGENIERAPVWIMRQAGRYLPEYQTLRKKYDFKTMYKSPELAAEITLQPVKRFSPDAAIIFSDIMVIAEALGYETNFLDGIGPVLEKPLRDKNEIENLPDEFPVERADYTLKALELTGKELPGTPVIGFSGAPWTLAKYMVDGRNLKSGRFIKSMMYGEPKLLKKLLEKITRAVVQYCRAQLDSGANLIQIFDSSASVLSEDDFLNYALPYAADAISELKKEKAPLIYFSLGLGAWLEHLPKLGADVISVDWTLSPEKARSAVPKETALQGNLDPSALYTDPEKFVNTIDHMISNLGRYKNYIANLGHGILPDIPVENVEKFISLVKERSKIIYARQ